MSAAKRQKAPSENDDSSPQESSDADNDEAVELMVTARAKRTTAGNRLSSLLNKEAKDDIDLLFAEEDGEEEDMEFEEEDEDASDAELESSSDDEDQGSAKDDDEDLAGERQLQKQDRLDRKKRKAQDLLKRPGAIRKRVKIDSPLGITTDSQLAAIPRQKKKSERVSWVPTAADAPTRLSSRKQTVKNREDVHQKLVISGQQREKIMRQMAAAQKRKDAQKTKPMTQAERMEEAAKMERKNAKSLNRWEEMEKKRAEEQKAKLEALHNRQLTGPVISSWSGIARWINGKVFQNGVREIRDAGHREQSVLATREKSDVFVHRQRPNSNHGTSEDTIMKEVQIQPPAEPFADTQKPSSSPAKPATYAPPPDISHNLLDGIHAYAALPIQMRQPEFTGTADDDPQSAPATITPKAHNGYQLDASPFSKSVIPIDEYSSRNLVALRNIDATYPKPPNSKIALY